MRGLPAWMLVTLAALAALLVFVGWHDREEAGYLPFAMGVIFAVFTLAAAGGRLRGEDEE